MDIKKIQDSSKLDKPRHNARLIIYSRFASSKKIQYLGTVFHKYTT